MTAFTCGEYKRSDLHRYPLNTEHTPMRTVGSGLACLALALIAGAACTDTDSATNLNPEGPPMIRQVRLDERYLDSSMFTAHAPGVRVRHARARPTADEVHPVHDRGRRRATRSA